MNSLCVGQVAKTTTTINLEIFIPNVLLVHHIYRFRDRDPHTAMASYNTVTVLTAAIGHALKNKKTFR